MGVVRKGSMTVAVEVPGADLSLVPDPQSVVEQDQELPFDGDLKVVMARREAVPDRVRGPVVVTPDQVNLTVEPVEDLAGSRSPAHGEVTQVVDTIAGLNAVVPPLDQDLVHLLE